MPATIVALHYWAGSGRAFGALRPLLPPATRLLAPDLPGFGQQPAPPLFDYSVRAYADWVAAWLAGQPVGEFTLLGHSMGGKIALLLAAARPPGLRQLVLLSPSPPPGEPLTDEARAAARAAYGSRTAAEKTVRIITERPLPTATRAAIVADNLRSSHTAWNAWLDHGSREDLTAQMATLAGPCHLLVGTHDRAIAPGAQRRLTLPYLPEGTAWTEVPAAGHLLPFEAPEAVVAALGE